MTLALYLAIAGAIAGIAALIGLLQLTSRQPVASVEAATGLRTFRFQFLAVLAVSVPVAIGAAGLLRSPVAGIPELAGVANIEPFGTFRPSSATTAGDVARLKTYVDGIGPETVNAFTPAPSLPDVGTMIQRLTDRLAAAPGDVEGWRMLGWSLAHTQRPGEAIAAYEKAIALAPGRADLRQALDETRMQAGRSIEPSGAVRSDR